MDSRPSEKAPPPASAAPSARALPLSRTVRDALKIVLVGGFGAGKTTLVGSVSEIRPLSTEETMTQAGVGIDPGPVGDKRTTTVAFDFGRITLDEHKVLYLFGAPGQERFWFLWDRLFSGALGAVVLVDTRRLEDSFYCIDRLEAHRMPFVVAVNRFPGPRPGLGAIRDALTLADEVPLIDCDARFRESSKNVLITLVRHLVDLRAAEPGPADPALSRTHIQEVTP